MPSAIVHGSGGTLLQMPLPGPVGVPGWRVSRRGYPIRAPRRHGSAHSRWNPAALRPGAVTLDYRVHKGVRVPPRIDVDYMGLQRLQPPHSQHLKALAFVRYLQEQIKPGGRRAGAVATAGHEPPRTRDQPQQAGEPGGITSAGCTAEHQLGSPACSRPSRATDFAAEMPASAAALRRSASRTGRTRASAAPSSGLAVQDGTRAVRGSDSTVMEHAASPREALTAHAQSAGDPRPPLGDPQRLRDQASMRCHASASVFTPVRRRCSSVGQQAPRP